MYKRITYKESGVDIDAGEAFVKAILPHVDKTRTFCSMDHIGSFAGMINLSSGNWKNPVLVACTDGVGTKLKIAFEMNRHDTIGIDLVAMSVNDLLVTGAQPVAFLDYLATSKIDSKKLAQVIAGICDGCLKSGCVLLGGETAEMPDFYKANEYDLAGFAVGIVDKDKILDSKNVVPGDILIGLPSNGLHSNGYSLVRNLFKDRKKYPLESMLPGLSQPLGEVLLQPTHIYTDEFSILLSLEGVKAAAHITGGGIPGNLPRILPDSCGATLHKNSWPVPAIFEIMQEIGQIDQTEMSRTFNMGLGMIIAVNSESLKNIQDTLNFHGYSHYIIGQVSSRPGITWSNSIKENVKVSTKDDIGLKTQTRKARIAVLGSGSGTNMQSLCNAIDRGDLDAEIVCVVSNNSRAFILERAKKQGIPAYHISQVTHPGKETDKLFEVIEKCAADTLVLAGYMKKIPDRVLKSFNDRVFNIHPALLPAFGGKGMYGLRIHQEVIRSGVRYTGATVHRVNTEYDAGEILGQRVVPVLASDTPETLAKRVLVEEHDLYWRVLKQYL